MESVNTEVIMGLFATKSAVVDGDTIVEKCCNEEEQGKQTRLHGEQKVDAAPSSPVLVSPLTALQDLTREYQEIDPVSSKSTSLSEVEEGQILESSSDAFDLTTNVNKRPSSVLSDTPGGAGLAKKTKKKISFSSVTAYYFPRAQGFTCIPSQGGSTLGMALKHSHEESFTLAEHANYQRRNHRRLLLQLRKRRKSRSATKASEEDAVAAAAATALALEATNSTLEVFASNSNPDTKNKNDVKESDSDDSDADGQQISDVSDSELEVDNYYFLQPVPTRQRRVLLRESGIGKIETSEKDDCRQIRVSRESCGCSCQGYCDPESCSCAQSGIQCQVDRLNFPCGCSREACGNPSGRVEFNPVRVRTHFIHTLMRMELENTQEPNKSLQPLHHNQQHPLLQKIDELPASEIDIGVVSTVSALVPPESHYNWDSVMQLPSSQDQHQQALQQPQHHASYPVAESLPENGWFCHYSNDVSNTYPLYSGPSAASSAEVFTYDQTPYDSLGYHSTEVAGENSQQHYTELVDSSSSSGYAGSAVNNSTGEFYTEYGQSYQSFDPQVFNYHHAPSDTYNAADEIYSYAEEGSSFGVNGVNANAAYGSSSNGGSVLDTVNNAPKAESSNSSSEEDILDMGSSLATIVKETMVSV